MDPLTNLRGLALLVAVLAVAVIVGLALDHDDPAPTPSSTTSTTSSTTRTTTAPPSTATAPPPTMAQEAPSRTTTTQKASRSLSTPRTDAQGPRRTIGSSAYCLQGRMANGRQVHDGAVASVVLPMGSTWRIVEGKLVGKVLTVEDTGGPRATFDVWMASCPAALQYGRPTLTIERIG